MGFAIVSIGIFFIMIGLMFGFLFDDLLIIAAVGGGLLIIGILVMRSVKDVSLLDMNPLLRGSRKRDCPHCGRSIVSDAVVCSYCGKKIKNAAERPKQEAKKVIVEDGKTLCENCHAEIEGNLKYCPYCGISL